MWLNFLVKVLHSFHLSTIRATRQWIISLWYNLYLILSSRHWWLWVNLGKFFGCYFIFQLLKSSWYHFLIFIFYYLTFHLVWIHKLFVSYRIDSHWEFLICVSLPLQVIVNLFMRRNIFNLSLTQLSWSMWMLNFTVFRFLRIFQNVTVYNRTAFKNKLSFSWTILLNLRMFFSMLLWGMCPS